MTPTDAAAVHAALTAIAPVGTTTLDVVLAAGRARDYDARAHLLLAGDRARHVFVVVRGMLREYFVSEDGVEHTKSFVAEAEVAGSLADLIIDAPSRAYIVAEEATRVVSLPFARLVSLETQHPELATLRRSATEALLRRKADREYTLLALDAEARYRRFRDAFPGVEARVAAKHVASYVGVTPVHLSRLRRRIADQNAKR